LEDPVEGMFSFVPARRADSRSLRFARPGIDSRLINPANRQSTWGSNRRLRIEEVRSAWNAICEQVLAADLLLGVQLETPERRETGPAIQETGKRRC
jgi:hypothetical protein